MRRFRFGRRRQFGRMVRRARPIVRAVTGITLAKRTLLNALVIPDITSVDFDNELTVPLLECVEAQDEELESDGTNIATAPLYSRITSMNFHLMAHGFGAGSVLRWMLAKEPDGETIVTNLATQFHTSNDTQNEREVRKMTIAKGMLFVNASNLAANINVRVSKSALQRISPLRENDQIMFHIAKDSTGTTGTLSGFGTIYLRANG